MANTVLLPLLRLSTPSGGSPLWQSQIAARREGTCHAPRIIETSIMLSAQEIAQRTDVIALQILHIEYSHFFLKGIETTSMHGRYIIN